MYEVLFLETFLKYSIFIFQLLKSIMEKLKKKNYMQYTVMPFLWLQYFVKISEQASKLGHCVLSTTLTSIFSAS